MILNILFMGSSDFSVPVLKSLHEEKWLKAVVTQPDKPTGRGKKIESPVVKHVAENLGLPVYQPYKLNRENLDTVLHENNVDLIVVAAYGKILPKWLLDFPKYKAINVHASLLPRWRGASPIQAAILYGDRETGVTIMKMDEGLDTGDILSQASLEIMKNDTAESLSSNLAELGGTLLIDTIPNYVENKISPIPQNPDNATVTKMIKKQDGKLDFNQPAEVIERKTRAFNPWPICFFEWNSEYLRVFEVEITAVNHLEPYQRGVRGKYPCIGSTTNDLILKTVQPSGKRIMDGRSFLNGAKNWVEN